MKNMKAEISNLADFFFEYNTGEWYFKTGVGAAR